MSGRKILTMFFEKSRPSGLRKTTMGTNSLAHRTKRLSSDILKNGEILSSGMAGGEEKIEELRKVMIV